MVSHGLACLSLLFPKLSRSQSLVGVKACLADNCLGLTVIADDVHGWIQADPVERGFSPAEARTIIAWSLYPCLVSA